MKSPFRPLFVVLAVLSLAGCDKPTPPAAVTSAAAETDNQLAEARDALQRQALEIETKTALMDQQLAEMEQSLKDRENAELRSSLDTLKRQNDDLREQADAARRQSNAITQRITTTPPQKVAPQPDYSLFYDRLAPFGRWMDVNGYGYCWRPSVTVAGWRPYVDGCWVWSALGWAWQSNEPFGWATYHYGRWINLSRYGWVWAPGSEWAPAWVAWRQSRDCVGWAPLPPEPGVCSGVYRDCDSRYGLGPSSYTFINTNQFVRSSYVNVHAPVTQQTTIFQHSVNVTQIVPSHSQSQAFVHQGGPPRAQMEQACGRPVPQRQVQTMTADQMPQQRRPHGHVEPAAAVAMIELPAATPGTRGLRPDVKEHVRRPALVGGFEGVPKRAATEIHASLAKEKETAAVQQQPVHLHKPHESPRQPVETPVLTNVAPVLNPPVQEIVPPVSTAMSAAPVESATGQRQPVNGSMSHGSPRHPLEAPATTNVAPVTNALRQESSGPALVVERGTGGVLEHRHHAAHEVVAPTTSILPHAINVVEKSASAVSDAPPQPPAESGVSSPPVVAEKMPGEQVTTNAAAEAEQARMRVGAEQAQAAAELEQRQQQEMQDRGLAEKRAAEQAAAAAEAEKNRLQAAAAQQEALAAQQQRMAADQAAEAEKVRQQADAAAAAQQQEMAAQQQRATAERMAAEQQAAAEAESVRQRTEAAAMQSQQEEANRRAAEEQQMRAQQETERRAQEMAQRQAEEQARRQQEAEMQRAQEQARRAAEEQQMRAQQETERRAQEMAQRQAEEQSRRQQEAEMQRTQEQARRAAEEQMRAQQEAAQRAQEMAQRQAEEAARRAQEQAQRQAEEQARRAQEEAQRAAAEAARNQPQPASPGA